jgi:MFS family permease
MGAPAATTADKATTPGETELFTVVAASASGTTFEWYDFFIFGNLTTIIARHFYSGVNEATGFILALATFAVGFFVRPLGAVVFGAFGDHKGRKSAFLITMTTMGAATVAVGLLPDADQVIPGFGRVGLLAPLALIALRVLQGFALGGEYGGAAIYVAEHAPDARRATLTSWIQTSASVGLVGAFAVILATRYAFGEAAFQAWAWRVPFLVSAVLLVVSLWIRLRLSESPAFQRMAAASEGRRAPLKETFTRWRNVKTMLLVLFAIMIAQGAVWYAAFFYSQFFMQKILKVDDTTVGWLLAAATAVSAFFYVFFGWLSDRVGRKPVMLFGMGLALIAFVPGTPLSAFQLMTRAANPALAEAQARAPVTVSADPASCSLQFDPVGKAQFASACDIAKSYLTNAGVSYVNRAAPAGATAVVRIGSVEVASADGRGLPKAELAALRKQVEGRIKAALKAAGYPDKADPKRVDTKTLFAILIVFVIAATALYGPQAAALVELFPTRVRYTGMGVPYNIGTGWVGGFLPAAGFAMMAASGNIYFGLWYPIAFTAVAFVVCWLFLPETKGRDLHTI